MDLSQANTEAYLWFHRFHEAFNRSIKMAAIGLCLVDDALGKGMPRDELKQLAYNSGGLWGGMPDWTDPTGLVVEARADLGEAGILRTFSALDRFVDDLDADLEGWGAFRSAPEVPRVGAESPTVRSGREPPPDRVLRYYERRGWDTGGIEFLLPVYRYYRLMRDCAAHRAGLVGPALAEASKEQQWSGAIKLWSARTGDSTSPPLVELREGTRVVLGHRDAICGSSVLLRIASDMNRRALSNLDKEGVTYLAFRRALVGDPPELRVVGYRTPVAVLHDALSRRYRVADLNEAETIEILKSLDLWARCRDEFARLQGRGYFPS